MYTGSRLRKGVLSVAGVENIFLKSLRVTAIVPMFAICVLEGELLVDNNS